MKKIKNFIPDSSFSPREKYIPMENSSGAVICGGTSTKFFAKK
jgi:hypothetical protein